MDSRCRVVMGGAWRNPLGRIVAVYADHKDNSLDLVGKLSRHESKIYVSDAAGHVVLSTCNRFEVYMDSPSRADIDNVSSLFEREGAIWHIVLGEEAILRLFRIASGLESAILGEPEVIGQIRDAWTQYRNSGRTSSFLDKVFHAALVAGKRARRETGISRGPASYFTAAIQFASRRLGGLEGKRILIVGGGSAGQKLTGLLCGLTGDARIIVASRSLDRARKAALKCPGGAVPATLRDAQEENYDAAFIAVRGYDKGSLDWIPWRSRIVVDLSNPSIISRNDNVVGIEDLQRLVERVIIERRRWIPVVERIIREEYSKLEKRLLEAEFRIGEIIRIFESRIESLAKDLSGSPDEYRLLRRYGRKLVHPLYVALRQAAYRGMSWEAFVETLVRGGRDGSLR